MDAAVSGTTEGALIDLESGDKPDGTVSEAAFAENDASFDAEFGIPPVDKLPTLESILNSDDNEDNKLDNLLKGETSASVDKQDSNLDKLSLIPAYSNSQVGAASKVPKNESSSNTTVSDSYTSEADELSRKALAVRNEYELQANDETTKSKPNEVESDLVASSSNEPRPSDASAQQLTTNGESQGQTAGATASESVQVKTSKRASAVLSAHLLKVEEQVPLRTQIASAIDRVDAGMPCAIAVALNGTIAVGTSHGLVLVFDTNQVLRFCVGNRNVGREYGGVSCLNFNRDSTRLLVGYAKGQMTMWDVTNGKLLRNMMEAHQAGTAVLHVRFTDDPTLAICNDSGGSVYAIHFTRLIGRSWETVCLFSGSRGEVCAIEPLNMMPTFKDHPLADIGMLAMVSFSKLIVVTLVPEMTVRFTHPLRGDPGTLPLIDWRIQVTSTNSSGVVSSIETDGSERVVQPLLAFARDRHIHMAFVVYRSDEDIRFIKVKTLEFDFQLIAMRFVNHRTLVAIDRHERLHVVDYRSQETLTTVPLDAVQLVYASSHFKAIATGSNVSRALALAAERACYQSIAFDSRDSRILLLGMRTVYTVVQQKWDQRVDLLVKEDKFREALEFCKACFNGTAKAVVGLGGVQRREAVAKKLIDVLVMFVDAAMKRLCPERGNYAALRSYYESVIPIIVDFALFGNPDVLFEVIFKKVHSDPIANEVFLESLDRHVTSGRLNVVPARVMNELLRHYQNTRRTDRLEAVLTHLDCSELDIEHLLSVCRQLALDDALIHLFTNVLSDYVTPLRELLDRLGVALRRVCNDHKRLPDETVRFGNRLLVYLGSSLCGRAYPTGDIPPALASVVRDQIYELLVTVNLPRRNATQRSNKRASGISKQNASANETNLPVQTYETVDGDYPYVRTLLHFDVRNFLNILALVFDDSMFEAQRRQKLLDVLLHLMTETLDFSPEQIGVLFVFVARQLARHPRSVTISKVLLDQIVEYLCTFNDSTPNYEPQDTPDSNLLTSQLEDDTDSLHDIGKMSTISFTQSIERQQVLIDLLSIGSPVRFDERWLLGLAERARFYRVCEFIYERQRRFDKVLTCYLRDLSKRDAVFVYAENMLTGEQYSDHEKDALRAEMLASADLLLSIDADRFVQLTGTFAPLSKMLNLLAGHAESTYRFLKAFFKQREAASIQQLPSQFSGGTTAMKSNMMVIVSPETYETFIELTCQFEQEPEVLRQLQSYETMPFRTQKAIEICERTGYLECVAFLYESISDIARAAQIHRTNLNNQLREATAKVLGYIPNRDAINSDHLQPVSNENIVDEASYNQTLERLRSLIISVMQFCQRVSRRLDEKARQSVWFSLFETVKQAYADVRNVALSTSKVVSINQASDVATPQSADPHCQMKWVTVYANELKTLTSDVLNMMVTQVSLPVVLHKFIQDPLYSANRFGEMRDLILGMLDTYGYERTLLNTCNKMMTRDLLRQMYRLQLTARSSFPIRKLRCSHCRGAFKDELDINDSELVLFKCGHVYHWDCIDSFASQHHSADYASAQILEETDDSVERKNRSTASYWRCPSCLALGLSPSERFGSVSAEPNTPHAPTSDESKSLFGERSTPSVSRSRIAPESKTVRGVTQQQQTGTRSPMHIDSMKYAAFRRVMNVTNSFGSDKLTFLSELKSQRQKK